MLVLHYETTKTKDEGRQNANEDDENDNVLVKDLDEAMDNYDVMNVVNDDSIK